jgi:hypothetical protein
LEYWSDGVMEKCKRNSRIYVMVHYSSTPITQWV